MYRVAGKGKIQAGDGAIYNPGEEISIETEFSEADIERLLKLGAIVEISDEDGAGNGDDSGDGEGAAGNGDDTGDPDEDAEVNHDDIDVSAPGGDISGAEGNDDKSLAKKSQRRHKK
jgi:hypothetical protein